MQCPLQQRDRQPPTDEAVMLHRLAELSAQHNAEEAALGFSLDELKEFVRNVQARLMTVTDDGEDEEILLQEIVRLLVRRSLRAIIPAMFQHLPASKALAAGGQVFSFVPETQGVFVPPRPYDPAKTEYYRRMFGGSPNPDIDVSQFERRIQEHSRERPDPEFPGSPPPSPR